MLDRVKMYPSKMKPCCRHFYVFLMSVTSVILTVTWLQSSRSELFSRLSRVKVATSENETLQLWETESTNCDYDCELLQSQLQRWPERKPKAFIYFLIKLNDLNRVNQFINTLAILHKLFNNKFRYPIVIFHEKEPAYTVTRLKIRSSTNSTVYFQTISFKVPDFLPNNLKQRACPWSLGYRHMCRFHAKLIYDQAIIRGFEFAWRLDDDSRILRPIDYDVFEFMRNHSLQYGYVIINGDSADCTVNLWESVELYIRNTTTNTTFFREWKKYEIFYNNFEISRLSLWLSADYQNYVHYIDRLGGIYYNRWGDAPIKTIAVSMFVPRNQTHHFKDIGYEHQGSKN